MRAAYLILLAAVTLAACGNPVADQAVLDTRFDATRSDTMLAVSAPPGVAQLDGSQIGALRSMVVAGQQARRAEFVVVVDGSGGPTQAALAQHVRQTLSTSGARWVDLSVEPAMKMGPGTVVVARSEYLIASRNCPAGDSGAFWNPTETAGPGFGCANAYNMGQMMARPRDAAIGRDPGPADATVNAAAIERYREGRVRTAKSGDGNSSGSGLMLSPIGGSGSSSTN